MQSRIIVNRLRRFNLPHRSQQSRPLLDRQPGQGLADRPLAGDTVIDFHQGRKNLRQVTRDRDRCRGDIPPGKRPITVPPTRPFHRRPQRFRSRPIPKPATSRRQASSLRTTGRQPPTDPHSNHQTRHDADSRPPYSGSEK